MNSPAASTIELLQTLTEQGVELWFEGERLRFRAPPGALSPELKARLAASRSEVLGALRARAAAQVHSAPLSYSQQALWFVQQEQPDSVAYNVAFALRIKSAVVPAHLRQALQALVDRHAILRTCYEIVEGVPVQRVAGTGSIPLQLSDVAGSTESALLETVAADYRRPFDLESGPVMRAALFSRATEDHVLLLTVHHVAIDGWSLLILIEEFRALLREAAGGPAAGLPRVDRQYADYVDWQRRMLADAEGERLARDWADKLAGPRVEIELPADRPRPGRRGGKGASLDFHFDVSLTADLGKLARAEGTTLYVVMLAAFKALLFRMTGSEDVIVGTPTFGRTRSEFSRVLGNFVNPVALRSQVTATMPFRDLLCSVRGTLLEALDAQEYPLALLVERLAPVRDPGRSPLFETMFVLQRFEQFRELNDLLVAGPDDKAVDFAGLSALPYALPQQEGQFDLGLGIIDHGDALSGALKFNTALFDVATMERLLGHLKQLLAGVVADPSTPVGLLTLLTPAERQWLLGGAALAAVPIAAAAVPMHRRFEAHAARTPDAIALRCDGQSLSYGELNRRANALAHRLQSLGVRPGVLVGLCAERSFELVTGLLAVLKAGGAYVPVDLSYPQERIAFMLRDADAAVLVTQASLVKKLPQFAGPTVLLDEAVAADGPSGDPRSNVGPDDLIYVIYTSGSTGTPKGTLLTHRAVHRLFSATDPLFGFCDRDVWTLFHSVAFDFSVWEIWGALAYGGTLVVVPHWVSRSPDLFLNLLHEEGVTVLNQTPSAFRQLINAEAAGEEVRSSALRFVIFGGEALELQSLRPWIDRHGDRQPQLINMYGITETCVHVTFRRIARQDIDASQGSVIGVPIPDLRVLLLDAAMQPVPVGVAGEMYVGGPGLARGYLNRPELSEQRFIADPFAPGQRLYRSGDLARRLASGELIYLGRIDDQVKIRGFRIELGEIESILGRLPGVRESALLVRDEASGDKRLVAYLALDGDASAALDAIRLELRSKLPDYMVPAAFVVLEALPLTINGKVDRKALPAPVDSGEAPRSRSILPLQGETQQLLGNIWCDVLGFAQVGRQDNFFELGGHSLLATQVVARVRRVFNRTITLRSLFEHPRLDEFAKTIDAAGIDSSPQMPTIVRVESGGPRPLSFAQERMWLLHELAPASAAYNMPVAIRLEGVLDSVAIERALEFMVERHEVLRTRVSLLDGRPVQSLRPAPLEKLQRQDLRAQGDNANAVALGLATDAARAPFDLNAGRVFRAILLQVADQVHILVLAMHHIAGDQWSYGVLCRELAAAYGSFRLGQAPSLPPLAIRYSDVGAWERKYLRDDVLAHQLGYWRKQLANASPLLLPTDRPRPAMLSDDAAWHAVPFPSGLIARVEQFSRANDCTAFMTLFAAYVTLLHRYSGQDDVTVAVPIANRERSEVEGLVGSFINTLVLRTPCGDELPFNTLLQAVRETSLDAYAHQALPFAKLVEELRPSRGPAQPPLAQVLFSLQNATMSGIDFPGLDWQPLEIDRGAAPFELGLYIDASVSGRLFFEYSTELYDPATIRRMAGHYLVLLESLLSAPQTTIGQLPMLTGDEQRRLLEDASGKSVTLPAAVFSRLLETRAASNGGDIAVSCAGESLSYAALNSQANALARRLRGLGMGRGSVVGVCLPRSLPLMTALLAVQKSGAAYLPLDPHFPAERIGFMLEDSGCGVLLTDGNAVEGFDVPPAIVVVDVRTLIMTDAASTADLAEAPLPADAAYLIYTSGSTGRPKGVVVPHGALTNFLHSMSTEPGLARADVLAAVTTVSFDIAGLELYLPWLVGARVELVPRDVAADGVLLADLLQRTGATVLQATPATWRLLIDAGWHGREGFRAFCGGEPLPRELANALLERVAELWNLYGPTETTIWSTVSRVVAGESITIGHPILNTQIRILDRSGGLVPAGVAGEICIGGAGLAQGYHRRPELTAERFVDDEFAGQAGGRLYRTGDLGRWNSRGALEHLGRADDQVKIRGFRIELGEIESVLVSHDAIRQAVVVAREMGQGDTRLVAFVIYEPGEDLTASEVRRYLRKTLPDYMLPSLIVTLDEVPLTPNGKVDRKALPDPLRAVQSAATEYAAPVGATEQKVAEIWGEVLGVQNVGAEDNFFDLGGHSLLTLRVAASVEQRLGWRMDPRMLFLNNLRQIAAAADQGVAVLNG